MKKEISAFYSVVNFIKFSCFLAVFFTMIFIRTAYALPSPSEVEKDKIWTITFNQPVKESTVNDENIYVVDSKGEKVRGISLSISEDGRNVRIIPPSNGYSSGESYTLKITTGVCSRLTTEKTLSSAAYKDFSIKKESIIEGFSYMGIKIGDKEQKLLNILGQPNRKDLSSYGFYWYIYNSDYSKYVQFGVKDGMIVGMYVNNPGFKSDKNITIGTSKSEIEDIYGSPLEYILRGNTRYMFDSNGEYDIYTISNYYATIFYDKYNKDTVTAIQLIEKDTEDNLQDYYGLTNDEVRKGYERQIFDLANSIRARNGKLPYTWDGRAATAARNHSEDMAVRNFFGHVNPDGKKPSDRVSSQGISWTSVAENIAAGQTSAIFAHEGWMNSAGHRANILGNCEKLGVGVCFGGSYEIYYTENFFTE